jgi:RNA polymerase sigma factor (TIGR02999 family)
VNAEPDIDQLLSRLHAGDTGAQAALFAGAYDELRKLARARLRDGGRGTVLDTTALVHESYLRCLRGSELRASDRRAFFAHASAVMRSVIVDTVRERLALRRGGDLERCTLDTALQDQLPSGESDVLHVHEALQQLAAAEPRLAQVAEMRYFGGYGEQEIAEALGVTERTVRRDWDKARAMLVAMLSG